MNAPGSSLRAAIATKAQAQSIRAYDLVMKVLLASRDTGGSLAALLAWHKPGEGLPDHFHADRDEFIYVVDGAYEMSVGGQTATVCKGAIVFIPRNTAHRFRNVGDRPACMLDWTAPRGQGVGA